ncbi:MAG: class I adenylate-forming enzyme family protein [Leucobacter sp.]
MSNGASTADAHTVGRWLSDRAAADPKRIAIDDRGVLVDYATLHARAAALARRLGGAGYGAGSRIATVSGNSIDHVVAFFACARSGIAFIPLSWRLTPDELAALLRRSNPDLLLIEDEHAALAGEALRALGAGAPPRAETGVAGVEQQAPEARRPRPVRAPRDDDPLLVIYTSGSEAAPKGVVLSHASCFWNNLALSRAMPMTSDDVVLAMLPQHHVAAWNVQPLLAWWVGATVVLERSFQPGRVLQLIQERRVTAMMGVPTQYRMLLEAPGFASYDLGSLCRAVVGGATIPPQLAVDWAEHGISLAQGYGLTEAGPNVLHLAAEELADQPGAVGRPYPSVDTRLVDPDTGLQLDGPATGELQVRGPSLFSGYLDDDAATAAAMSDGWLRTGDLLSRDEIGVHRVVDRLKNIYVSGGENVAPAEVEQALAAHPLVEEAAVVGVPDAVWGERGYAFVVVRAPLAVDELLSHARSRLAGYKLPAHVEFVSGLPRSTIEKVARQRLAHIARQRLDVAGSRAPKESSYA